MNKSIAIVMGVFVAVLLLAGAFSGGLLVGHLMPASEGLLVPSDLLPFGSDPTAEQQAATPDDLETLFAPFWEAWSIVHDQYVDQPVDDMALMRGAIRGMMEALGDEQTFYMEPSVYERQVSSLQGSYEGIGAYVDVDGEYLTIISPIDGSPADTVGLQPGDKVIAIDGEDMTGVDPSDARLKVLGPEGSTVTLTVAREGVQEPLEFTITRAEIILLSADGRMLEDGIGYVDINAFGDKTTQELRLTLDELMDQNPRGLVVDLRNNPGGYLATSVEVSSEFIEDGVILIEQFGDGRREEYSALGGGRATEIPLVVLINEGSASASEILAGALQDYGRAKLVGVQSYGKGSVQILQPLSDDQGAARVTIAKWLTPDERAIEKIGLTPDVVVEMTAEDFEAELDPQLEAAVETLLAVLDNNPMPTSMPTSIPAGTPTPVHE